MRASSNPLMTPTLLGTVALALTGCGGGSVQLGGAGVSNAEEILVRADDVFSTAMSDAVAAGTTTRSDDSRCFFLRDGDQVDESLYCGPVRRLGMADTEAWFALPITSAAAGDGEVVVNLAETDFDNADSIDAATLFRPDGAEPVDVSALDEPRAPAAPVQDFAVLAPLDQAGVDAPFEQLDEPYTLVTTAATVTVEAVATLDVLPRSIIALAGGLEHEDEHEEPGVAFYRPADDQQARAWQVTIGSPPVMAPEPGTGLFSDDDGRDASAAFALAVGSQRLSVLGDPDSGRTADSGSFTVPCEQVQCEDLDQKRYLLVASTSGEDASLIATVDGADQALSLADGTVDTDVSQVANASNTLSQQVSTAWPTKTITVRTAAQLDQDQGCCFDDVSYSFGGEVQRVYLAPFDFAKGWAPAGKAWLIVPIANQPHGVGGYYGKESIDRAASLTLTVGETVIASEPDAGADGSAVFLVDDTFSAGTLTYRPTGSVKIGTKTYPLVTDDPLTLEIDFSSRDH